MTVYSSELEQIGEDKSKNGGVIAALRGETRSELVHKGTFSALEGEVQDRALVQSYIPRYDPASGKVAGVFEVYTDATRYFAQMREKQWYIVGAVIGLLALLYLALFLIVNVAQKIISRQSEEHFRSLVEQSITGICVLQDGKLAYANPRFAELLGYSADKLTGVNPDFFVIAENLPRAQANVRALLEGRQRSVADSFGARRNGGTIVELGVHMARALFKGKAAVIVLAQDITERKRAQDRIAAYVKQLESSMLGTVKAVSSIVEMRDPYTAGHERRVGGLARAIGAELGLPEDRCKGLEVIGLVHDIGKMATPAEILSKPGRLLPTELALIKGHAQAGYDIMKEVESPWPLAQAILQHHERLDGSGYPHGLKGEEILLEARILAVADVVEAMATHRPYRPSLGIEAALEEIAKNSGKFYDPRVAAACLTLFREKGYKLD
jgi:PAS domain S-box-containing protein